MNPLVWLAIPAGALLLALVWVYFVSRPERPVQMHESMEHFERFRTATDRVLHEEHKRSRRRRRSSRIDHSG